MFDQTRSTLNLIGMLLFRLFMLSECLLVTGTRAGASLSTVDQNCVLVSVLQLKN